MFTLQWYRFHWTPLDIALLSILSVAVVISMTTDLKTGKIYNILTFSSLGLLLLSLFLFGSGEEIRTHLWSLLLGGAILFPLFAASFLGGGDTKLLLSVALAFPASSTLSVLFSIFIMGGLQALIALKQHKASLPYSLAIASGLVIYFLTSSLAEAYARVVLF